MIKIVRKNIQCFVYLTSIFLFLGFNCETMAGEDGTSTEVPASTLTSISGSSLSGVPSVSKEMQELSEPPRSLVSPTTATVSPPMRAKES